MGNNVEIAIYRVSAVAGSCLSVQILVSEQGHQVYAILLLRSKKERKEPGRETGKDMVKIY